MASTTLNTCMQQLSANHAVKPSVHSTQTGTCPFTSSLLARLLMRLGPLQDFIERLPTKIYTDPRLGRGPLNLAGCLQPGRPHRPGSQVLLRLRPLAGGGRGGGQRHKAAPGHDGRGQPAGQHAPGPDALWKAAADGQGQAPAPPTQRLLPLLLLFVRNGDAAWEKPG